MMKNTLTLFLLLPFFSVSNLAAEDLWGDDDWGDDAEAVSPLNVTGFVELAYGHFTGGNVIDSTQSMAELRQQIDADYTHEHFELNAKADITYDEVLDEVLTETREFNVSASFGSLDTKLGRQVHTWGVGDYVFLNDLFPKDWQSFFAGRDDEYLKAPSDSLKLSSYLSNVSIDLVWTPDFTSSQYISGERFSFYSPLAGENVAPDHLVVEAEKGSQLALRVSTAIDATDLSFYAYKGYWPTPLGMNAEGQPYFPQLQSIGASVLSPLGAGLFSFEFSYYDSKDDANGGDPSVPNDQLRVLFGYEFEAAKDLTLATQWYLERTQDYERYVDAYPFAGEEVDENRQLLTMRLTYRAFQQKLNVSIFTFYSPTDKDAYIKPSVAYRYDDHLLFSVGANVFIGDEVYSFFGQHEENSNVWFRVRYNY